MFLCILEMVNAVLNARREAAVRRNRAPAPAPAPLLDGVKRANWTTRPDAARRLGSALAERGEVAYCVGGVEKRSRRDRRADARADADAPLRHSELNAARARLHA
jgi:hypothetical protein